MRGLRFLVCAAALAMTSPAQAELMTFDDLPGWAEDDHLAALQSFLATCDLLDAPDWGPLCRMAPDAAQGPKAARAFFELFFRPVQIGQPPALFTGYYEPELDGSPVRTARFRHPIYARPPELTDGVQWHPRSVIDSGILSGRGLEIAWLEDPVDVFFLQVQGSGRIRMPDGRMIRVGYAGRNGHAYRSIGQELVRRGIMEISQVSARGIRNWVRANPALGGELLGHNPSYIFFRKLKDLPADKGPIGAMGRSLTNLRSVAVDPAHTPLGAPVWIDKHGAEPMRALMVAQDTGGAIKGAQRADIFFGTGFEAGEAAGEIKDGGRMLVLLPIDMAWAMANPEG